MKTKSMKIAARKNELNFAELAAIIEEEAQGREPNSAFIEEEKVNARRRAATVADVAQKEGNKENETLAIVGAALDERFRTMGIDPREEEIQEEGDDGFSGDIYEEMAN